MVGYGTTRLLTARVWPAAPALPPSLGACLAPCQLSHTLLPHLSAELGSCCVSKCFLWRRKHGLYGSSLAEAACIDMLVGLPQCRPPLLVWAQPRTAASVCMISCLAGRCS